MVIALMFHISAMTDPTSHSPDSKHGLLTGKRLRVAGLEFQIPEIRNECYAALIITFGGCLKVPFIVVAYQYHCKCQIHTVRSKANKPKQRRLQN